MYTEYISDKGNTRNAERGRNDTSQETLQPPTNVTSNRNGTDSPSNLGRGRMTLTQTSGQSRSQ